MSSICDQIENLEHEIKQMMIVIDVKQEKLRSLRKSKEAELNRSNDNVLTNSEINRFSRQIILPEVGVEGQIKLRNAKVLIVGAGGLGCPAALYLCGAGIGHIGIIDYDTVELSNLHRQIVHQEHCIGISKALSIKYQLEKLNSMIQVTAHTEQLNSNNALEIIRDYDIVLDATDNVATRYLLNDACVFASKPLVSGSALQFEGQLTVYNYKNGPCYRCLFPKPPPPETVTNCGDGGVLGGITGVIGALQAFETIKIVIGIEHCMSGKLLLFDGITTTFRNVRLRGKSSNCDVCVEPRKITTLIDYEQFCGMKASDKDLKLDLLPEFQHMSVQDLNACRQKKAEHLLIDVRSKNEFEICHLDGSENYPIKMFNDLTNGTGKELIERIKREPFTLILCLCRRGNDSQIAAKKLTECLNDTSVQIRSIIGGLHAWADQIDVNFPKY